jgi:Bacteriophage HK97-gp10, putative tail-component
MTDSRLRIDVPSYAFTVDKKELRRALRGAGNEVAAVARSLIKRSQGSGRIYYKPGGGRYQASAAGQAPVSRTGNLATSIKVRPGRRGDSVSVRDSAFYALILQAGAKGGSGSGKKGVKGKRNKRGKVSSQRTLEPRPFLTTALTQREDSIAARVRAAVVDGVKFQRIKA